MNTDIYRKYVENFNLNLLDCKVLGKGHNGTVFLLPDGKVIKICLSEKNCKAEYSILKRINGNKYFPRVYELCGNYMIRDYVGGEPLYNFIKKNGLNREISIRIIELLVEFKRLNFEKQDIRCKDIFIQDDKTLMVIDPKKCFSKERDFPRHLSKGLYKLGVLDTFLAALKEVKPELYNLWNQKIYLYVYNKSEE